MRNKLTLFVFSLVVIASCIAQKESFERKIDINGFEEKEYYTKDSTYIEQFIWGGGYGKKTAKKDSLYLIFYNYYNDGHIKYWGKSIRHGSGTFGKWYYYDEKGNMTKIRDKDDEENYTYKFEDVLAYAERNKINLHKAHIYKSFGGWAIRYTGYFEGEYDRYTIILDKQTGEKDITVGFYSGKKAGPSGETLATYDTLYYKGVRYPRE